MRFEWDESKASKNLEKHGISFSLAITVFDDPFALIAPDEKHSAKEEREWIIGKADKGYFYKKVEQGLALFLWGGVYEALSYQRDIAQGFRLKSKKELSWVPESLTSF